MVFSKHLLQRRRKEKENRVILATAIPEQHSEHLAISAAHLCKLPVACEQHGSETQTECSALLQTLQGLIVPRISEKFLPTLVLMTLFAWL
jgi:hypothetical protein